MRSVLLVLFLAASLGACSSSREAAEPAGPSGDASGDASGDFSSAAPDSFALDAELPVDPAVRTGRLPSGVTYYVRRNTEPEDRAELRLVVDAGSVLEAEDQRGLAHFLEHMLFNGTRRFPEQELVGFLERTGMRFGPDVNAYTSFDETVYMLTIPTDSTEIVERAFDVLEDWAAYATLSDAEIDKERGVVVEEWRLRTQNAQGRIQEQILPALLHGARYADRLPIGLPEVIREAGYETVRRFYRDWYRPDLMAVVAVGDFDPDRFEALIRAHFAGLPAPAEAPERPAYGVPPHEETLYVVAADPEYPVSSVEVTYKRPAEPTRTVADYRSYLVSVLFNRMLNDRFAELARRGDAAFIQARAYRGSLVRPAEVYGLEAQVQDDSVLVGLEALLAEAERARRHGFTETELSRQKEDLLRGYRRAYQERENIPSDAFADDYTSHFLEDEPIPGIAFARDLADAYVPGITLDEVDRLAEELLSEGNRVVTVTMPQKEGLARPDEADLAAVFDGVREREVAAYVDDVSDLPLVATPPEPAAVAHTTRLDSLGVTEVLLENGVRVVMKPTDFKEDEVRMSAFSPGGSSLASDADYVEAANAATLVARSGAGAFDRTALEKRLAGKVAGVAPYISELEEGLSGSASPEDLETLFQLTHLFFTAPRADSTALAAFQNQQRAFLANRSATPYGAFQDTLLTALYGDHPRRRPPTIEEIDALDLAAAHRLYRDRFADASDFTFLFVGAFDPDVVTELARRYLGTLPALGRDETWRDVAPEPRAGVVEKSVYKGEGDQSQVALIFHGPAAYGREERHQIRSLADVLTIRLREELREELGGVYNVNVQGSLTDRPDSSYQFVVAFGTAPERADELAEAVFAQIERLKADGPTAETLARVKEQQRRERETSKETNAFWIGVLDFYYAHPGEDPLDVFRYEEMIEDLSPATIQSAARRYLDPGQYVQVVLRPDGS